MSSARVIARQSVVVGIGLLPLAMLVAGLGYLTPVQGAILQEAIDVAVILNALRPGASRAEADAREALAEQECEIAPCVLHDRADFRSASMAAQSAQELSPTGKAAQEVSALYN